jgi:Ca2+-binding EF-hand superfamily protein
LGSHFFRYSGPKTHPAYDYISFTQVPYDRFEDLKRAFILYDKQKKGEIKASGFCH